MVRGSGGTDGGPSCGARWTLSRRSDEPERARSRVTSIALLRRSASCVAQVFAPWPAPLSCPSVSTGVYPFDIRLRCGY